MNELNIRPARVDDAALLAAWAQAMAMETEHKRLDLDTVTRGVRAGVADAGRARYFIAERNGVAGQEPVGTLMLTFEWSDWRCANWWWIQSVYVAPEHRRQGVYAALYKHVHDLATATPEVCGLRLYVEKDNSNAQRTYESLGMCDAGYRMYEAALPWLRKVIV